MSDKRHWRARLADLWTMAGDWEDRIEVKEEVKEILAAIDEERAAWLCWPFTPEEQSELCGLLNQWMSGRALSTGAEALLDMVRSASINGRNL